MAIKSYPANKTGADRTVTALSSDTVNIGPAATVSATAGTAVYSAGSNVTVNIRGQVVGKIGVALGDNPLIDTGHAVNVLAGGSLFGANAIVLRGQSSDVVNDGQITGVRTGIAIVASGVATETSTIVNRGLVGAQIAPIQITSTGEAVSIRNEGQILNVKDGGYAIFVLPSSASTNGRVTLVNTGLIDGLVNFGSGNDRYEGSTGTVTGPIFGAAGNDRFTLGTHAEKIYGGTGIDTVSIVSRLGARVALDNSFAGTGRAALDKFSAIENATGSNTGADVLRGNGGGNLLDGRGGADRLDGAGGADQLFGGAGADRLTGGAGVDRLTGGTGNDTFLFRTSAHGGDVIGDFGRVTGNDDRFAIDNAGFDRDLDEGVLDVTQFRTRATSNVAADADDRFIFRTSDTTLWFDRDGVGGSAPVLLADLQAGAVVTAADILIF